MGNRGAIVHIASQLGVVSRPDARELFNEDIEVVVTSKKSRTNKMN